MIPRTLLLIIPGLLLSVIAAGQNQKIDPLSNSNVYFLKNSGQIVKTKDSADYIRIISPPDSSDLNLFVVNDYYLNGKLKLVGKTLIPNNYIKRHGVFVGYFPNGHRKSVETYDNGVHAGNIIYYYPNGNLYYTAIYDEQTRMPIIVETRDSIGNMLSQNGNGTYIEYDAGFKTITGKGPVVNGLKEGEWQGNIGDSIKYTCLFTKGVGGAGKRYDKLGKEYPFNEFEVEPQFKDGTQAFYTFLLRNIHYPKLAKDNNIQGQVFLSFMIEKDGRLTDIHVLQGVGAGINNEAMRVLKLSPPWIPHQLCGQPVKTEYTLPISFALEEN